MNHLKDYPPHQRKGYLEKDYKSVIALFCTGRFWGWFALAWLPSFVAIVYRTWASFAPMPVFVGAILSAGATAILVQSLLRSMTITNTGVYLQKSEPFRYWLTNILTALAIGLIIVATLKS
jgi:hypothetical protein